MEGYNCISQGCSCTSNGGLILYLNNKFKYVDKMKLTYYRTCEGWVIQVNKGDCPIGPIIKGHIYRPPDELVESDTEFRPILNSLESKNDVIIAGNFTKDLLKINDKTQNKLVLWHTN